MVAGGRKLLVAIVEGHPQFIGAHDRLAQNIATHGMEAAGGGIHHHQSLGGEGVGNKLRESLPKALPRAIAGGELIEYRAGTEDLGRLGHQILDVLSQGQRRRPR